MLILIIILYCVKNDKKKINKIKQPENCSMRIIIRFVISLYPPDTLLQDRLIIIIIKIKDVNETIGYRITYTLCTL